MLDNRYIPPFQFATQPKSIFANSKSASKIPMPRQLIHPPIDKSRGWGYFDGTSQGTPRMDGTEATIHLSDFHFIRVKIGLEQGENNFTEHLA